MKTFPFWIKVLFIVIMVTMLFDIVMFITAPSLLLNLMWLFIVLLVSMATVKIYRNGVVQFNIQLIEIEKPKPISSRKKVFLALSIPALSALFYAGVKFGVWFKPVLIEFLQSI